MYAIRSYYGYFNNEDITLLHSVKSRTFAIGWGVQNVYYKYLTVDFRFGLGYNKVGFHAKVDGEYENPLFYKAESKLFSDNLFMLKLSVGWIIF